MSESLGTAVLDLDADAGPLEDAVSGAGAGVVSKLKASGKLGGAAVAAGLLAGGVAIGVGLYKIAGTFDDAYDSIETRTGATGKKLDALKGDFDDVFSKVPADAKDVGTAIGDLNTRLGLTGKPLREMATQMLNLSRITGTDLETNIENVSKAFKDWAVPVGEQSSTLDGFFRISQKTGVSVADLASSVQKFGSPLRQVGFSLGEAASMFGVFESAGVNVQTLMPGFKMAIGNFIDPTDDLKATFERLGIAAKTPKAGLEEVLDLLGNKSKLSDMEKTSLAMEIFGKRAGADMAEAIKQGRLELGPMLNTFKNGKGTINDTAESTMDFEEKLTLLKNRGMLALKGPAMALFDGLTKLANGLLWVTDKFSKLDPETQTFIKTAIAAAAGVIGLVVAFQKVSAAFSALSLMMSANPYVLLAAATVALVILVVKNWDKIKEAIGAAWDWIKTASINTWNFIKNFLRDNWKKILYFVPFMQIAALVINNWDRIKSVTTRVWTAIKDFTGNVWDAIRDYITGRVRAAVTTVTNILTTARETIRGIFTAIKDLTDRIWDGVREKIGGPVATAVTWVLDRVRALRDALPPIWDRIVKGVSQFSKDVASAVTDAFDGLKAAVKSAFDYIKEKLDWIASKVPDIDIPFVGGGRSALSSAAGSIPGFTSASSAGPTTAASAASGAAASSTPAPQVNISFDNGLEWLRDFVRVEIDGRDFDAGQAYIAGGNR